MYFKYAIVRRAPVWNFLFRIKRTSLTYLGAEWPISHCTQVWKNTHILMISNSVTHLLIYTNTDIAVPCTNVPALSTDIVALNGECFMMSHNVS